MSLVVFATLLVTLFVPNAFAYTDNIGDKVLSSDKVFTISFNQVVDKKTVNVDTVYVLNAQNQRIDTLHFTFDSTGTKLYIHNSQPYEKGAYTLYVSNTVKNLNGKSLNKELIKKFQINSELNSFTFTDAEDSHLAPFIDVLKGSLQINKEQVILELDVKELPEQLTFRKDMVNIDAREYGWSVDIMDSNSLFTFGTFSFKFKDGEVMAPINSVYTQTDVWKDRSRLYKAEIEIIGNKIKIIADTPEELNQDTINSIRVLTEYDPGSSSGSRLADIIILK